MNKKCVGQYDDDDDNTKMSLITLTEIEVHTWAAYLRHFKLVDLQSFKSAKNADLEDEKML